jgi:hypothetical protein
MPGDDPPPESGGKGFRASNSPRPALDGPCSLEELHRRLASGEVEQNTRVERKDGARWVLLFDDISPRPTANPTGSKRRGTDRCQPSDRRHLAGLLLFAGLLGGVLHHAIFSLGFQNDNYLYTSYLWTFFWLLSAASVALWVHKNRSRRKTGCGAHKSSSLQTKIRLSPAEARPQESACLDNSGSAQPTAVETTSSEPDKTDASAKANKPPSRMKEWGPDKSIPPHPRLK